MSKRNNLVADAVSEDQSLKKQKQALSYGELLDACKTGDTEVVIAAIGQNIDLNFSENSFLPPLHTACLNNKIDVVRLLLNVQTIDVNRSFDSLTPLHIVCHTQHTDIVKLLLKHPKINVDSLDNFGDTPLHYACENGNIGIFLELLDHGAYINTTNNFNVTPLFVACRKGRLNLVKKLIKRKAYFDISDALNTTPFEIACFNHHIPVVKELLPVMKLEDLVIRVGTLEPEINTIIVNYLKDSHNKAMILLLYAQKQPSSPLSMLYRDILQDISIVLKEKLRLK